jgi:Kef-type K+ transport system membrane component KefB
MLSTPPSADPLVRAANQTIPAVPSAQVVLFFVQLVLLLALALGLGRLAQRLHQPAVVGELLAGLVIGPSLLGHAFPRATSLLWPKTGQTHLIDAVSQLGVVLLVGLTGSEVDLSLIRRRRAAILWTSTLALLVPLATGMAAAALAPRSLLGPTDDRRVFVLYAGVALCVSAVPVIAKTLTDMNLLHRDVGQLTLAASAIDDAAGWILLSLVSAAATTSISSPSILLALLGMCGVVMIALLLRRPISAWASRAEELGHYTTTAPAILMILASAAITAVLGLEPIFGAFVCGLLLASDAGRRALAPVRALILGIFAPIFLATAGLRVDLTLLSRWNVLSTAIVVIALATAGKVTGAYIGARLGRLNHWEALALGSAMNGRGLVEIVVATVGLRLGVLTTVTYTVVVLMAIVSSMLVPPFLRTTMRRVERRAGEKLTAVDRQVPWSVPRDESAQAPTSET